MSEQTFEQKLERLRSIVTRLESGEMPLEEGVALYREGLQLAKACGAQLESARHEVKVLGDGLLKEFDVLEAAEHGGEPEGD